MVVSLTPQAMRLQRGALIALVALGAARPATTLHNFFKPRPVRSTWLAGKPAAGLTLWSGCVKGQGAAGSARARPRGRMASSKGVTMDGGGLAWPPLPPGTPLTALPKQHLRASDGLPGAPVQALPPKVLKGASLEYYLTVNMSYPGLRLAHLDPPVFLVPDFFSPDECERYQRLAEASDLALEVASPTFGAGLQQARTSTTWFLHYAATPELLSRARLLLPGVSSVRQFEEPQLVRYAPGQQFRSHFDHVPEGQRSNGGQRLATLLVYLNDMDNDEGAAGATVFRDLGLAVKPRAGMALLFFPAFAKDGGIEAKEAAKEAEKRNKRGKQKARDALKGAERAMKRREGGVHAAGGGETSGAVSEADTGEGRLQFRAGDADERTLHAGTPPLFGTKWITQLWTHEYEYNPSVPPGNKHPPE